MNIWEWLLAFFLFSAILTALYIHQVLGIKKEIAKLNERLDEVENRTIEGLLSFESHQQLISEEAKLKLDKAVNRLTELRGRISLLKTTIEAGTQYSWYRSSAIHKSVLNWAKEEQSIYNLVQSELGLISNIIKLNRYSKEKAPILKDQLLELCLKRDLIVRDTGLPLSRIGETLSSLLERLQEADEKHMYDAITSQSFVCSVDVKRQQVENDLSEVGEFSKLLLDYQRKLEAMRDEENGKRLGTGAKVDHYGVSMIDIQTCEALYQNLLFHISEGEMDTVRKLYKQAEACLNELLQTTAVQLDLKEALTLNLQHQEEMVHQIQLDRYALEQSLPSIRYKYTGVQHSELNAKLYHLDSDIKHITHQITHLYLMLKDEGSDLERIRIIVELYNRKLQESQQILSEISILIQAMEKQLVDIKREFSSSKDRFLSVLIDLSNKEIEFADNRILVDGQEQIQELLLKIQSMLVCNPYHLDKLQSIMKISNEKINEFVDEGSRLIRHKEGVTRRMIQLAHSFESCLSNNYIAFNDYAHIHNLFKQQMSRLNDLMSRSRYIEANREMDQLEEMWSGIQREYSAMNMNKTSNIPS